MGTSELLSVPYSLYAKTAGNGFSGNYNDLSNKPALWDSTWHTIKNKPTTVAGYGITDAMTTAHAANGISTGNIANWNAAFGWGNHAVAGYLTSFTETDPIFGVHPAKGITSGNITNWNTAFGWGNHAAVGYLTSFTETDPIFGAWDKSTGIAITESQISDLQDYLTEELDADPANELQTVTQTDYDVSLSQGGGSFMTGVRSYTQAEIDAMTPYNGLTVHNTTTNCINYYYVNNWFEACGTCTPQPSQANAGADQIYTDNTVSAPLAGNVPARGTGLWTVVTGEGGSFDNAASPAATFTGLSCTSYTLAWNISNSCGTSADQMNISLFATPTMAFAGQDTIVEVGVTSLNLYANAPEMGNGFWSILSGEGGIIDNAASPTSLFTGIAGITYTLQWAISTQCATSTDVQTVFFNNIQVGVPFQGGIVAYILQPSDPGYVAGETHGLIAAPNDQSTGAQWGCYGTTISGADGTALGTGNQNTIDIEAGCTTEGIAADICANLTLGGFSDWFLPSKNELNKLYINKVAIGGFVSDEYWSSSEYTSGHAWSQSLVNGGQYFVYKNNNRYVRAVRAF